MNSSNYDSLRERYPKYISKGQLREICKISPASALYLLEHGIIPSTDTGKKTWRYRIYLEDAINYLEKKKEHGSMIPLGAVTNKKVQKSARSFASVVKPGMEKQLRKYFSYISEGYPDVLTISDLADLGGICKKTIIKHINQGHIKYFRNGTIYIIPKKYALDYLSSHSYINSHHYNATFEQILGGFKIWIAKSSQ